MADRVVVLENGRVLQSGTPREIYLRPATPRVARQLGQPAMNLLEIERRNDWWTSSDGTPLIAVADAADATPTLPRDATRALLGIRPEHLELGTGPLTARIELIEETGPTRVVVLTCAGLQLRALCDASHVLQPGAEIAIELPARHRLFWSRE